jgi:hypothetical protein
MDFSKLSSNEKLAIYGSVAVILAGLISNWGGLLFLSILAAVGVAVVVFLPQFSPTTSLPGSKGSLLAALGIIAAAGAVITALQWIGYLGLLGSLNTIMFYIAVIGSLVMAWAGWQELQSEGGKWVFGTTGSPSTSAAAPPPAAAAPPPAAAPQDAPPPPSADTAPMADAPADRDDEDRPSA